MTRPASAVREVVDRRIRKREEAKARKHALDERNAHKRTQQKKVQDVLISGRW